MSYGSCRCVFEELDIYIMAKFGNRGTSLVVCSGQNVVNHYLKVLDKVGDEVVIRSLCSVFQKLMKVTFKNFYVVVTL